MTKLLLLSVVLIVPAVPLLTARMRNPRRGLQLSFLLLAVFVSAYVSFLVFFLPRPEGGGF